MNTLEPTPQHADNRPTMKRWLVFVAVVLGGLVIAAIAVYLKRRNAPLANNVIPTPTPAGVAVGAYGAVVSGHYLASQAGLEVLQAGGNAVDAAAAIQFALNVVQVCGIGLPMGTCMGLSCHLGHLLLLASQQRHWWWLHDAGVECKHGGSVCD
jgi:hypothetical protein